MDEENNKTRIIETETECANTPQLTNELKPENEPPDGPLMVAMQPGVEDDQHDDGEDNDDHQVTDGVSNIHEIVIQSADLQTPSPNDDATKPSSCPNYGNKDTVVPMPAEHATSGQEVVVGAQEEVGNREDTEDDGHGGAYVPSPPHKPTHTAMTTRGVTLSTIKQEQVSSDDDSLGDTDFTDEEDENEQIRQLQQVRYPTKRTGRTANPNRPKTVPKKRAFAYRLQWRNRDMLDAMKVILEKKMTIRGAAKKYHVPYSTLKDRVHGRVQHGCRPGVKTVLSPEEEEDLVRYVKDLESTGFQLRCIDIRERAGEILHLNRGHNSPYRECSPGHNWLSGFIKRHPDIKYEKLPSSRSVVEIKKAIVRPVVPSIQKQKSLCRRFYDNLLTLYKKQRVHNRPDRIYSVAEIRLRGVIDSTVLVCASADGRILAPFVVFRGNRLRLNEARDAFPDAFFTSSADGKINERILLWWFRDHFLKKIPAGAHRPCVLLISRPVNEITFQLSQLGREEKIMLVGIPQNVSHLLQPIDEVMGSTIQSYMAKKHKRWAEENPTGNVNQRVYAELLHKVWRKCLDNDDIQSRFSRNGIYPINEQAISADRFFSASIALKESMDRRSPSPEPMPQDPNEPEEQDDSPFSGLNLLSTLSSHEYASLSHKHQRHPSVGGFTSTNRSAGIPLRYRQDFVTQSPTKRSREERKLEKKMARIAEQRHRQRREAEEEEAMERRAKTYYQADNTGSGPGAGPAAFGEKALLQHLLQTNGPVPAHPRPKKGQNKHSVETDIQEALRAAKGTEQINQAIQSIEGPSSSPPKRGRGRPRKYPNVKTVALSPRSVPILRASRGSSELEKGLSAGYTIQPTIQPVVMADKSSRLHVKGVPVQEQIECEEVSTADMLIEQPVTEETVIDDAEYNATNQQTDMMLQNLEASNLDPEITNLLNGGVEVKSYVVQEDGSVVEQAVDNDMLQQVLANQINQTKSEDTSQSGHKIQVMSPQGFPSQFIDINTMEPIHNLNLENSQTIVNSDEQLIESEELVSQNVPDLEHIEEVTDANVSNSPAQRFRIMRPSAEETPTQESARVSRQEAVTHAETIVNKSPPRLIVNQNLRASVPTPESPSKIKKIVKVPKFITRAPQKPTILRSPVSNQKAMHISQATQDKPTSPVKQTVGRVSITTPNNTVLQQNADGASTPAGAAKKTPRIQVIKASQLKDLINSGKKVQVIRIPKRKLDDGQSPGTSGLIPAGKSPKIIKLSRSQLNQIQNKAPGLTPTLSTGDGDLNLDSKQLNALKQLDLV